MLIEVFVICHQTVITFFTSETNFMFNITAGSGSYSCLQCLVLLFFYFTPSIHSPNLLVLIRVTGGLEPIPATHGVGAHR